MSLINNPLRRIAPGANTEDTIFQVSEIPLVSDVTNTYNTYPLTGTFADEEIPGWSWSRTFAQNLSERSERINSSLESNVSSYEEGSKLENWQGCVISGLEYKGSESIFDSFRSRWVPYYSVGEYSLYHKSKRIFSDYSNAKVLVEEFIPEDQESGEEEILNELEGFIGNEFIAIYKRDKRFVNFPFYRYFYDKDFSKNIDNSYYIEEQKDSDDNLKSLVRIKEFKKIKIGGNYRLIVDEGHRDILGTWEYVGKGNDSRSIIYTEYFPIVAGSFKLLEETVEGNLREWNSVNHFSYNNQNEFIVNNLNGTITINSIENNLTYKVKQVEDLIALGSDYTKITFYEKVKVKNNRGVITIEDQDVSYYDLSNECLYVKTSDIANIGNFEEVLFKKEGANFSSGSDLYIMYEATARIDYEIIEGPLYRSSKKIDLKPYKTSESRGLLEINPYEKHLDSLTLTHDLQSGEFLKIGSESLKIKATAKNSALGVVKEIPVNFYCNYGNFNNGNKLYFSTTNQDGNAFAYYNWSYEESDSYIWISGDRVTREGNNTVLIVGQSEISSVGATNVSIFQTLKIDPFYGNFGQELEVDRFELQEESLLIKLKTKIKNYEEYVGNEMNYIENRMQELPEEFCKQATNNHSFGYVLWNSTYSVGEKFIVLEIVDEKTIKTNKNFFRENSLESIDEANTRAQGKIRLYRSSELEYSPEIRRQRGLSYDRLLYEDNGTDLVPITPNNIVEEDGNYKIIYNNKILPLADENNPNNIVAGYKMFLNKKAVIYAQATDPATGRTIESNRETINVSLPDFLKNNAGFTFGEEGNLGDGLGGSNFINLDDVDSDSDEIILYNPFRNGINIIIDNTED